MLPITFDKPDIKTLKKKYFVVDMHHHTKYSHDSNTSVEHIVNQAETLGICVAITDHNTISGVLKAYETARGRKYIIPGIEVATKETKDILIYFYDVKELQVFFEKKIRPRTKPKSSLQMTRTTYALKDLLNDLQKEHCVVVLPHPVCARIKSSYHYFQKNDRQPLLKFIDAIEVINETMTHKNNLTALGWALQLDKPITAGSDGHRPNRVGEAVTYAKAKNKTEFLDAVKKGQTMVCGKELRPNQRLGAAFHLVMEKAKVRKNKRLDKEYQ